MCFIACLFEFPGIRCAWAMHGVAKDGGWTIWDGIFVVGSADCGSARHIPLCVNLLVGC